MRRKWKMEKWEYHLIIIITGILYIIRSLYMIGISLLVILMFGEKDKITEEIYELPAIFKYYLLFKINFWWFIYILLIIESLILIIVCIQFIRLQNTGRMGMKLFNFYYILKALWNIIFSICAFQIRLQDIPTQGLDPARTFLVNNGGLITSLICIGPFILIYISVLILLNNKQVKELFKV